MIKLLFILVLPFALNASKILSYNIYDRTDRVDVMITFDTPYDGTIKQTNSKSKIVIKLENTVVESPRLKQLKSKFLHALSISPMSGYTQIVASIPPSTILKASKTSDAYGLRLRFTKNVVDSSKPNSKTKENPLSILPTKANDDMSQSYYIVVSILIIGIILLFIIKKKIPNKYKEDEFKVKETQEVRTELHKENNNVSIRFQKSIDTENSVVMLDFGNISYLVLMGKTNILLDKLTNNIPSNQNDFETILQNRHKELDDFLNIDSDSNEALEAYKEKAATLSYSS